MDFFAYSEPVSVHGALNDWQGDFAGGEVALTHDTTEVGWSKGKYQIGFIHRYDTEMEFSRDTAEITYQIKNKIPLELNKTYQLDLSVRHTYSQGAHIRYTTNYNQQLTITTGVSLLQGLTLTEGQLTGHATTISESNYDFQFDVDYYYSKDHVLKRDAVAPNGYGFSTDLLVDYQYNNNFSIKLKIIDLLGRILWLDSPKTTGQANSDNAAVDEDGWIIYQPTLSGRQTYPNFLQKLRPIASLSSNYKLNDKTSLTAKIYHTEALDFLDLGTIYTVSKTKQMSLSYMPKQKAVSLGAKIKTLYFGITSDQLEFHKSHVLNILFGFTYPL